VLFVYHCQYALVPRLPPDCVNVVLWPLQIVTVELRVAAAIDVTLATMLKADDTLLVPQLLLATTLRLPEIVLVG